jgi:hypothetical protein
VQSPAKAILVTLTALLAACANTHWANDKGEVAAQQTISDCSQRSMARASGEAVANGTYVSAQSNAGARTGRTEFPRNQVPAANTGIQEQTFFNMCMKEKGYDLVQTPGPKH